LLLPQEVTVISTIVKVMWAIGLMGVIGLGGIWGRRRASQVKSSSRNHFPLRPRGEEPRAGFTPADAPVPHKPIKN
jgi:hypothetical protein